MTVIISFGVALLFGLMNGILSIRKSIDKFIEDNNNPDIKIITNLEDINKTGNINDEEIKDIEYRLSISTVMYKKGNVFSVKANTYEDRNLKDFYINEEKENISEAYDILVEKRFAMENNIKLGDMVKLKMGKELYDFCVTKIISIPETAGNVPINGMWVHIKDYGNVFINRNVLIKETNKIKVGFLDEIKKKEEEILNEQNKRLDEYYIAKDKIKDSIEEYNTQKESYEIIKTELNQKKDEINESIEKFKDEQSNFPFHLHNHYSTSAFIYYYLMRMNPYGQNMIKLQNFKIEDPDRIFNSYKELEVILKEVNDNRELIPDMFCYFDYFCNLNCAFMGFKKNGELNDDFKISNQLISKYTNNISRYVNYLYTDKKLLNSTIVSKVINRWVDIIFGKNQLPENFEEAAESCNIYNKLCYEQKVNFEQKFAKYQELIKRGKISPKIFINKMKNKIDLAVNFGMTPRKIFNNNSVQNEEKNKTKLSMNNVYNSGEDKLIYFKKLPEDSYLFLKDYDNKKNKSRIAVIFDNNNFKSKKYNIYYCKSLNLFKINKNFSIKLGEQNIEIPLYNPSYSISYLYLKTDNINKINIPVVLSCRYLGNYFLVQILDKSLRVFCEDIVTCIKGRNLIPKGDENFFTGLLNGKLIEWKIRANFNLREIKHVYSHQSSITAIEIFSKQRIIITAGEDKFIYIRKLYDFELLTVIDLTYSFGNPIVSQTSNVFPILLKISDLNLIYVLLYNYESKNTFIRGYNLNGLFFAQSDEQNFIDNKSNNRLLINNISFTKNSNLVVGFYYSDKYSILEPWGLTPVIKSQIIKNSNKMEFSGIQLVEFDYKIGAFYILYNNEFYINSSIEELKKLESF